MKAFSLHIGVAKTDVNHYGNALVPLPCCISDAKYMQGIMTLLDYEESILLLDEDAVVSNVKHCILQYSRLAKQGDLVVITYSGHGSHIFDANADEPSGEDQTWCLFDRQIIDDEFRHLWKEFDQGVNVLLIIDSCHSGTAYKNIVLNTNNQVPIDYATKVKSVDSTKSWEIFQDNKDMYEPIAKQPLVPKEDIKCFVTGISACQDDEEALAGRFVSFFTRLLINTLSSHYSQTTNYADFVQRLVSQSVQLENIRPNISSIGKPTDFFETTKPFLRKGQAYPDGINTLFNDLVFGSKSIVDNGLTGSGLLVDHEEGVEKELKDIINPKAIGKDKDTKVYLVEEAKTTKLIAHPWDKAYLQHDQLRSVGKPFMSNRLSIHIKNLKNQQKVVVAVSIWAIGLAPKVVTMSLHGI